MNVAISVDGYDEIEEVGVGGHAHVYRAHESAFGRPVALKALAAQMSDPHDRQAFERECQAIGSVSHHPNIVTVYAATYSRDGRPVIAMEYFDEGTLADRLRREGSLPARDVVHIGVDIAGALATAHAQGIYHRDIKPQNIFCSSLGSVALGDFGISSFADEVTVLGSGGFTVHYAPPEVIEGASASAATDIYSLGATLYTLAAGQQPFPRGPGQSMADLARLILMAPRAPRLMIDDMPEGLDLILADAMDPDAQQRIASAVALGRRLQRIQLNEGWAVTPLIAPNEPMFDDGLALGSRAARVETTDESTRRRTLVSVALGAMALGVVGLAAVVLADRAADRADARSSESDRAAYEGAQIAVDDPFFTAPATPSGVQARWVDAQSVLVEWDPVDWGSAQVSYEIVHIDTDGNEIAMLGPAISGRDNATVAWAEATDHCIAVRAVNDDGHRSASTVPVCPLRPVDEGS